MSIRRWSGADERPSRGYANSARALLAAAMMVALSAADTFALPFNDDMVANQLRTGSMMRKRVPGTIAVGSASTHLDKKEDALKLTNPSKGDPVSEWNGRRLFHINCAPCHGDIEHTPVTPGVAGRFMGAPDLTAKLYNEAAKSDGYIYGTMQFGGLALMPPVGWKLSPAEHWDIINYLRKVQASKGS